MNYNKLQIKDKEHYVYAYYDEQGQLYYVGKGKGRRYKGEHRVEVPPKDRIKILHRNLTDEQACEIETQLIQRYGRKDIGTGILENRWSKGYPIGPDAIKTISKKVKISWQDPNGNQRKAKSKRISISKKLWQDPEYRKRNIRPKHKSEEFSRLRSKLQKAKWQDPSYKKMMIDRHKTKSFKAKMSKIKSDSWKDPECRAKMIKGMKNYWSNQ